MCNDASTTYTDDKDLTYDPLVCTGLALRRCPQGFAAQAKLRRRRF